MDSSAETFIASSNPTSPVPKASSKQGTELSILESTANSETAGPKEVPILPSSSPTTGNPSVRPHQFIEDLLLKSSALPESYHLHQILDNLNSPRR